MLQELQVQILTVELQGLQPMLDLLLTIMSDLMLTLVIDPEQLEVTLLV